MTEQLGTLSIDLTLSSPKFDDGGIGIKEHRSKNTLGRSVPVKTMTYVEETSEDGSPRPVCMCSRFNG